MTIKLLICFKIRSHLKNMSKKAFLFKQFAQSTSCHGLSRIDEANSKRIKLFWILLVFTVFGIVVWQISERIAAYFKYETNTQTSEIYYNSLPVPTISICNLNRYFFLTTEERQALNTLSFIYDYGFPPNESDLNPDAALNFFNKQGENFNFTNFLLSKAWQLNSSLIFCRSGMFNCTAANFTPTFTSSLGLCWTLRSKVLQHKPGMAYGLQLYVNISQSGYSEDLEYGRSDAGVAIQVHSEYEPVEAGIVGDTIGVGTKGAVSMRKEEIKNMYFPWGQCRPENEKLKFRSVYSISACSQECVDNFVIDQCSCRDPVVYGHSSVRECNASEVFYCAAPSRSNFEYHHQPSDCDCFPPCSEIRYDTDVLTSNLITGSAITEFLESQNIPVELLEKDVVALSFYYKRLSVKQYEQNKAVPVSALLSDIGGQFGLWIGISVVTFFEFLQFLVRLFQTPSKEKEIEKF